MIVITTAILIFALVGAADFLIGKRFGVGKEFEKGFSLFGPMALSMLGMIVLAPAIGVWLTPVFDGFYNIFKIDPSIIPASLLANDMGGTPLAQAVCKSEEMGNYNAFVISSMMGCAGRSFSRISALVEYPVFVFLACGSPRVSKSTSPSCLGELTLNSFPAWK